MVIEVASTMLPGLNLPDWTVTLVIALVVLGFPITVLMGWMFDLGPGGMERTAPLAQAADAGTALPMPVTDAPDAAQPTVEPHRPQARVETDRRTIAVLPFVNMSGDAENEYFSDGIAEEILNLLSKLLRSRLLLTGQLREGLAGDRQRPGSAAAGRSLPGFVVPDRLIGPDG